MKKVLLLVVMFLMIGTIAQATPKKYISKVAIDKKETQIAIALDNIVILPTTKTIVVRVMRVYLDDEDKVLRSENAGQIIYKDNEDNPETEENEATTAYTDFLALAGIDIDKITDALIQ